MANSQKRVAQDGADDRTLKTEIFTILNTSFTAGKFGAQ